MRNAGESALPKGSSSNSAGWLAERENWLRSVNVEGREELLFEFEMLLRGIERYFHLHNLPLEPDRPVVTRDFREELADVRDALDRGIAIARRLLDPDSDQKMVFRKYVETQLIDDRARWLLIEDELDQDSPQESLFLLRQSFEALRTIIDHLLYLPSCSYALFNDIGNLALREVVLNRYFRPFRPLEFRIEYDRIKSVAILEALARMGAEERRLFTTAFLALFRLLHYLSYVSAEKGKGDERPAERRGRVLLALVHSEAMALVGWLKSELAVRAPAKKQKRVALRASRDIERETERILASLSGAADVRGAILDAAAGLSELFRRNIALMAAAIDPILERIPPEERFAKLVSRAEMANRLRTDLWVFGELCRTAEQMLRGDDLEAMEAALDVLRRYIPWFQDVSYQLLRHGDHEAFDRFTAIVLETESVPQGQEARARLADECRLFAEVAQTTFEAVSRRAELAGQQFDPSEARTVLLELTRPG